MEGMEGMGNDTHVDDGTMEEGGHDHAGEVHLGLNVPIILVIHFVLIAIAMAIIVPYAFVCKRAQNSKWLPVQILGAIVAGLGSFLGHFAPVDHYTVWFSDFAAMWCIALAGGALVLQVYVPRGILAHARRAIDLAHTIGALVQPLVCFVFVGLGVISLLGFCKLDHTGQCLAHGIMGTAFIVYGMILGFMMLVGGQWLKRQNRSQEFYDSTIITLWGIINTFTEHSWGNPWNHGDVQHTSMGIVWWAAGLLGMYLSWDRVQDKPRRHPIPALIIIITGYSMITHAQALQISTTTHYMFGVVLTLAGLSRIIEISFVLQDKPCDNSNVHSWQYIPVLLLIESGFLFMSATEEAMLFLHNNHIMAAPYILFISSFASIFALIFLFQVQSYQIMVKQSFHKEGNDVELHPLATQMEQAAEFDIDSE